MSDPYRRSRRFFLPGLLLLLCSLVLACERQQEPGVAAPETWPQQSLRIGLLPEQDIFVQKQRYAPIAAYLAQKTGLKVELRILSRYGNIIENFTAQELDGAFFGSFTGAMAIKMLDVEPLARPQYADGVSTYYGMIFVRKESGIRTAADMKGKTFAMVDQATTAGWLLPLHYFHEHRIGEPQAWLREIYFSGTHEDVIRDVIEGRADIGAAKDLIFDRFVHQGGGAREQLEILAVSPPVPSNTLALRRDLDSALKARLRQLLLTMHEDLDGREALRRFGAERFLLTTPEDYQPVFDYAASIGLDLANYNYRNL